MTRRSQMALAILALWIATFAAYSNSFTISFQFDDTHTVQSNMYIRSLKYVPRYFVDANTTSYRPENSGYRPMTTTALALGFAISHIETWGYHLIKVVEQCLAATLLLLVGLRLLPQSGRTSPYRFWIAWLAALIFAVHRANTETVDYICAISTLQAGMFDLLAFYLYLRWRESKERSIYFWLSVLCFEFACMSKEEAITLPAVILLYEWFYLRRPVSDAEPFLKRLKSNFWDMAQVAIPYVIAAVIFTVLRVALPDPVADSSRGNTPTFIYFITQFRSWLYYWKLFFWPVTLNADNLSFDFSPGLEDWRVWGALAAHLAVWFGAWQIGKKNRFVAFAVAWIYVTVLPASSVFRLVEAVNEHRMYLPYMCLALLSVWAVFNAVLRFGLGRNVAIALVGAWAIALGAGAYARNAVWQTDVSLWEDVYAKNPASPRAMNVLGVSLLNQGEYERSTKLLEECHRVVPNYLPCIVHLSIAYAHGKQYDRGLEILRQGYGYDPNYVHINFHLGLYYKEYYGDLATARAYLAHAHELSSGRFFQATLKLAEIDMAEGNFNEAMKLASSVLQIDLSNGDAWETYAKGYMLSGDLKSAGQILERLVHEFPTSWRYQLLYGGYCERKGDFRSAYEAYRKVVQNTPQMVQAWSGLVRVAQRLHEPEIAKQASDQVEVLKRDRKWEFVVSLFMPGEKANQISPE